MSYSTFEASVQDGDPVFRFLFAVGTTNYTFTTGADIVSDGTYTYTPAPIVIGEMSQTNELAKDPLTLDFPRTNNFASLFLGGVPEQVTSVTVFRGHLGDVTEDYTLYWKGRVSSASASGDSVRIECENIFTSMRRAGLRAKYQKRCRHALYQSGCGLDSADFDLATTATAAAGFTVTIPDLASAPDPEYYVGGVIETSAGFQRYIVGQDGTTIRMIRPLQPLVDEIAAAGTGVSVTLYPGCDHTRATCETKFSNLDNYGGFPWIPSDNPFGGDVTGSIS